MQIAGSYAEVLALLERLRGRYEYSRDERRSVIAFGAFFTLVYVAGGILAFANGNRLGGVVIALLGPLFILWLLAEHHTVIEISDTGIEKRAPLRVWRVAPGEIQDIELSLGRGWYLKIDTTAGVRVIALFDSLQNALAVLYPEVTPPKPLPKRVGTIAYAALALVVIAVAVLIWVLVAKGLFEW